VEGTEGFKVIMGEPTEDEFRAAGYTARAAEYPLSEEAFRRKCEFNKVKPENAPLAWRYAPNLYMQEFWEGKREI
jgi:hypothetical protein